ncbi:hypothetical protein RJ641_014214 [Dillenia turbinata]|uniref:Uncharacterized protein n=1 Tax=Dillenia turbinata TaxID=194707 RepID=A0AAN8Z119_9MAGN
MKSVVTDYFADLDDQGSTVAMDVDDVDPLEIFVPIVTTTGFLRYFLASLSTAGGIVALNI